MSSQGLLTIAINTDSFFFVLALLGRPCWPCGQGWVDLDAGVVGLGERPEQLSRAGGRGPHQRIIILTCRLTAQPHPRPQHDRVEGKT